jgi:GNAT superfamily N-acetyltransferase
MAAADLDLVRSWLSEPGVAQWYLTGSSVEDEVGDLRRCIDGDEPTEALIVTTEESRPIGWCQWYLCRDYPEHAAGIGAPPEDVGIDYAIGDPTRRGHGEGTELIAALVTYVRQRHPNAGVIADPEASNGASRRVLEKNLFQLLAERPVASEPTQAPMAIYRRSPDPRESRGPGNSHLTVRRGGVDDAETVGALLHDFNREFDEPTPGAAMLAERVRRLLGAEDTTILLGGAGPDGVAVLRFRPAIWSDALECSLAELYVAPHQRGHGLGRALVEATIEEACRQGADHIELATEDTNTASRALYESLGFTNGGHGSIHHFYQRALP